jgi:hypothetical protein
LVFELLALEPQLQLPRNCGSRREPGPKGPFILGCLSGAEAPGFHREQHLQPTY